MSHIQEIPIRMDVEEKAYEKKDMPQEGKHLKARMQAACIAAAAHGTKDWECAKRLVYENENEERAAVAQKRSAEEIAEIQAKNRKQEREYLMGSSVGLLIQEKANQDNLNCTGRWLKNVAIGSVLKVEKLGTCGTWTKIAGTDTFNDCHKHGVKGSLFLSADGECRS